MRYIKFLLPAVLLSGCSLGSHGFDNHAKAPSYGQQGAHHGAYQSTPYQPACEYSGCESGYSVSNAPTVYGGNAAHAGHQYGAPQTPSANAYGGQVAHHNARGPHGYGQVPNLRRAYKYGTLGATMYDVDSDIFGIQGRVGYQSAGVFGVEAEASTSLSSDSEDVLGVTTKTGIDYQVAGFAVLRQPISEKFSIHARGGYHVTEFDSEATTAGVTTDLDVGNRDGFAYGVGGEYNLNRRDSLRLDFTRYDVEELGSLDSVSVAYARKF
ncbi:outer membrane beta-barrel protein [Litorimonas sp. RW-G-Af-16]|uniref:outer membrane beta-barrel protein n=1 Tax=Litorimonas sp. RW-G-Af-16 TaxID=3241168 RepID=UPI00390CB0EB